jgi:hypothetical protein
MSKKLVLPFALPFLVLSLAALYGEGCSSSSNNGGTGGATADAGTGGHLTGTGGVDGGIIGTGGHLTGTGGSTDAGPGTGGVTGTGGLAVDAATDVPANLDAPPNTDVPVNTDTAPADGSPVDAGLLTYNVVLTAHADGADVSVDGGAISIGSGTAVVTLNPNTGAYTVNGTYEHLSGKPIAAHIHAPAGPTQTALPIQPASITFDDTTIADAGAGNFTGTFTFSGVLNNNTVDGGLDFVTDVETGLSYVNVHTPTFPAGEIRGQINQAPAPDASAGQ